MENYTNDSPSAFMEINTDPSQITLASNYQPVAKRDCSKFKTHLALSENVFSLFMLSVFFYMSGKYFDNKYFKSGVDETLFWNIFNHLTPFFVARGIQLNVCSFANNIKELCCKKANDYNAQIDDSPLVSQQETIR